MPLKLNLGDIVELKKKHPCGNNLWEITRTGADIRIKCKKCEHQVLVERAKLEKNIKKIIPIVN